uniref:Uncharacterized protein n=1 Tax=Cucumis melo TaxID=3656 RepID=A0A9I9DTH5_CUCME
MGFFSQMFSCCFFPSRVSADHKDLPGGTSKNPKRSVKKERKEAPIVVSYFPVNSYPSRL